MSSVADNHGTPLWGVRRPRRSGRRLSWARSWPEVAARRDTARQLRGERLVAVRYYALDFLRSTVAPDHRGHRLVESYSEWESPVWHWDGFDVIDFGLELQTSSGRVFSVTWDPPGNQEGIGIEQTPLVGSAFPPDAEAAVWDVAGRSRWQALLDERLIDVHMHYRPWHDIHRPGAADAGPFWCPRITLTWPDAEVDVVLGDPDADGALRPSSDTIAVVFEPRHLPCWVG